MTEFEVFKIVLFILLFIAWVYICFQVWRIDKLTEQVRTLERRIDFKEFFGDLPQGEGKNVTELLYEEIKQQRNHPLNQK